MPTPSCRATTGRMRGPTSSLAALLAVALVPAAAHAQDVTARALAPHLYLLRSTAGSNVLAVAGSRGTLLVDAGPANGVEALARAIDSLGIEPVRFIVNTHYHDDHIGGNAHFVQRGAVVIAHPATRSEAQIDTVIPEFNDWRRTAAPAEGLPTVTVNGGVTIYRDAHTVHVVPLPGAHTAGDLIVRVDPGDVVHTGDVYEIGAYPFIDVWAGGSIAGMLGATRRLLTVGTPNTRYVPGHGDVGARADIERYRAMLAEVCAAVVRERGAGKDLEAVMDAGVTAPFDDTSWGPARHGRVLAALISWSLERGSSCASPA